MSNYWTKNSILSVWVIITKSAFELVQKEKRKLNPVIIIISSGFGSTEHFPYKHLKLNGEKFKRVLDQWFLNTFTLISYQNVENAFL